MKKLIVESLDELPGMIRNERKRQNLSQRQLAYMAGVGNKTVGTAELGKYTPHVEVLLDIHKALGYDIVEFRLRK